MAQLVKFVVVAVFSALTLAAPAQADEASYLDYLDSHGFTPGAPVDPMPDIKVKTGHSWCGLLRSGFPEADLRAGVSPRYGVMVDAAQHELCPDTLGMAPTHPAPPPDGDQRYLDYLNTHGWAPGSAADRMTDIQVKNGHYYCGQLRSGFPEAELRASVSPRYGVMIDAAQRELCPDTLGAGS